MSHGLPTKAGDAVVMCNSYGHVIGAGTVERVTASGQFVVGYDRYTARGSIIGLGRTGSIRLRTQADELPLAVTRSTVRRPPPTALYAWSTRRQSPCPTPT